MQNFKLLLLLSCLSLSGCMRYISQEPAPNIYYLNPAKDIKQIGRVAIIELTNNSSVHYVSDNFTESFYQELQKKQIFGLTKIAQEDSVWKSLQLDINTSYTFEELLRIHNSLKCDAILTGIITGFEPYPHMAIGLRLQLIDLSDGQLIWALEQVWDTTDKKVQDRIEAFYNPKKLIFHDENLSGQLGSVSSLKFFKFVSYEVSTTLKENH